MKIDVQLIGTNEETYLIDEGYHVGRYHNEFQLPTLHSGGEVSTTRGVKFKIFTSFNLTPFMKTTTTNGYVVCNWSIDFFAFLVITISCATRPP